MRKVFSVILAILCIGVLGTSAYIITSRNDKNPPVIVASGNVSYYEGISNEELLTGMTAVDDKSGNVTSSLSVEGVELQGETAAVTYTAQDQAGNVARFTREMTITGQPGGQAPEDGQDGQLAQTQGESVDQAQQVQTPAQQDPSLAELIAQDEAAGDDRTGLVASLQQAARTEQEAVIAALNPEAPQVHLTDYYVEVQHDTGFDQMVYLSQIIDNVDSQDFLMGRLQVYGEVNMAVPGIYSLSYFVLDSDGYQSNMATLTVRVL